MRTTLLLLSCLLLPGCRVVTATLKLGGDVTIAALDTGVGTALDCTEAGFEILMGRPEHAARRLQHGVYRAAEGTEKIVREIVRSDDDEPQ